ncbi:MAG: hypothetical protein IPH44_26780 [Myxococcales bacterium]|nr:hypothetical protein [Myxococcales bacterium]
MPELVGEWLRTDPVVDAARRAGAWTDFCDQIAANPAALYFQSAEHSAQQSKHRLAQLEASFKQGTTNVLSCSTTMEMGVNLGGLSSGRDEQRPALPGQLPPARRPSGSSSTIPRRGLHHVPGVSAWRSRVR